MNYKKYFLSLTILLFVITANTQITEHYDSIVYDLKIEAWNQRFSDGKIANQSLHKGLSLATKENNELDIGYFYRKLISQKGIEGNMDSAQFYFDKGIVFYSKTKEQKGIDSMVDNALDAHLYSELAEAYHRSKNAKKAVYYYKISDSLYGSVGDTVGEGIAKYNFGDIYFEQGNYTQAIKAYTEAEKDLSTSEYYSIKALIYRALSNTYASLKDTNKSLKNSYLFLNESLKSEVEMDSWILAYYNVAQLEFDFGDINKSKKNLKRADAIIDSLDMFYFKLYTSQLKAEILIDNNESNKAVKLLEKNLALLSKFNYNVTETFNYKYTLGTAYLKNNQTDKAITWLSKLETKASELDLLKQESFIAKSLSELYGKNNNFEKAFFYLNKNQNLNKQVLGIEKEKLIRNVEAKFQNEKKENELLAQKNKLNENKLALVSSELKNKNKNFYLLISGILILFLIFLFYYIIKGIKSKKEKQLLAKELLAKEEKIRISRDLHDHIASELTLIKSKIDQKAYLSNNEVEKQELNKISDYSKQAIDELRKTIWATRTDLISLKNFENNIEKFICRFDVEYEIVSEHKEFEFPSIIILNVFRICQEAINNAVKYSSGNLIKIIITEGKETVVFKVIDNGKGFEINKIDKGYGLLNMEERVKEIGGEFSLHSSNEGTTVTLKLSKNK